MKKTYLKPDAEIITFYTEEAITSQLDINTYANGMQLSVNTDGLVDNEEGWD